MAATAQVAAGGRPQKSIVVEIATSGTGATDKRYEKHCSSVEISPTGGASWRGGTPDAVRSDPGSSQLAITAIQAWDDVNSLVRFFAANVGKDATLTYFPHDDASFSATVTFVIPRPPMGGKVNQYNESTMTMPCSDPVYGTTAVPALPGA